MIRTVFIFFAALYLAGCASVSPVEQPAVEEPVVDLPLVGTYWVLEAVETPAYRIDLAEAPVGPSGKATAPPYASIYLDFRNEPTEPDIVNYEGAPDGACKLGIGFPCSSSAGWYVQQGRYTPGRPLVRLSRGVVMGVGCDGYWGAVHAYLSAFLPRVFTYSIEGDVLRLYFATDEATHMRYRASPRPEGFR